MSEWRRVETMTQPDDMPTFWELLTAVRDEHGMSEAWILKKAEMNHGTFSAWRSRGIPILPPRRNLLLLAHYMKVDYEYLLNVMLHTARYLPLSVAVEETTTVPQYMNRSRPANDLGGAEDDSPAATNEGGGVVTPITRPTPPARPRTTKKQTAARKTGKGTAAQRREGEAVDDDLEPR